MSETASLAFFEAALQAFARASSSFLAVHHFRAGSDVLRFMFASRELHASLLPASEHISVVPDSGHTPALTVRIFTSDDPATCMPPPPWDASRFWTRGRILGFSEGRFRFHYEPGVDILTAYDRERREGVYWLPKAEYLPWWERSFPLRMMMHFWSTSGDRQPLHAGAVGLPDGGVLIAGPSGSGKSTSTLSCVDSELLYAGDDYVLAACNSSPQVFSLYNTAKVEADNVDRVAFLRAMIDNPDRLAGQKAMIFLHRHRPEKISAGFPIRAILIPRVTGKPGTTLTPAKAIDAVRAIAPTTILHLCEDSATIMGKVSTLARSVPVYHLNAGTDLPQIPAAILSLLRN